MKILCVVLLFCLVACERNNRHPEVAKILSPNAPPAVGVSYAADVVANETVSESDYSGDLIMKTAQLRFQVDSVEKSTRKIEAIALKYNGFVAGESISNEVNEINNSLTLRVPAGNFENFIQDICKEAVFVNYKKIVSQNVTEEFQDIQGRLKTKREVRDRYTDILKTKAKTVEDILKAEEHIRVLQEEIESREGRLRFLQSRTTMSEVTLQLYQKVIFTETPTLVEQAFSAKITDALKAGWAFVTAGILIVISCWPLFIACSLMVVAWRRFKRTRLSEEKSLETSVD